MNRISALIHTRNEAANLADALQSVVWADELVVADMASTDATVDIAHRFQARVLPMPTAQMVESVRNLAVDACRSDWVLVVDADERVSTGLAKRLRTLCECKDFAAVEIPFRNHFMGVWLKHGWWPDYHVRFFRRGAVRWSHLIHELPKVEGRILRLEPDPLAAMEHLAVTDLGAFLEKRARYSQLDAQRLVNTLKPSIWPFLVRRPLGEFYGRYFRSQAWRHGMPGLVWSLALAAYELQVAMNYWALLQSETPQITPAMLRHQVRWEAIRSNLKWLRF